MTLDYSTLIAISQIIDNCETLQSDNISQYSKEMAKVTAYEEIKEQIRGIRGKEKRE